MDFGAKCAFDHVTVSNDAILVDEETAAARQLLASRIESLDGDRRRLYATNEIGKVIRLGPP